VKFSPH